MDWWIGHHQSELIAAWGPPHQTAPDGAGGTVFVYNFPVDLGQLPGRVYAKGKEVRYTDPERLAWNRVRMFYVKPNGVIYSWRWEGGENLFCSGCGQYRPPQQADTQDGVKAASGSAKADTRVPCDQETQLRSLVSAQPADITIRNDSSEPLKLYWLDYQGRRKLYANVAPGQSSHQRTFLTHPWVLADRNDACVQIFYAPANISFQYRLPQQADTQMDGVKAASGSARADTRVPCDQETQLRSLVSAQPADITVRNDSSEPLKLYWLDHQGRRKLYANVAPGQSSLQRTSLGHPWVLADRSDACVLIFYGPANISFP